MKKITAIFTAVLIFMSTVPLTFAETEDIVFDTTEQLSKFYKSVSDVSVSNGVLSCNVTDAKRSAFRTSCNFALSDYDEAEILIKCSNIKNPSSNAIKKEGKKVPVARLSLKVIDKSNTMSNKTLDLYYVQPNDNETYSTSEYISTEAYLSDLEGYDTGQYNVYSITVYPAYGFSSGTVYLDSLKLHKVAETQKKEIHEQTTNEEWLNTEFESDKEGWTAIDKRITLSNENGELKYISEFNASNQSGWMYKSATIEGSRYYRLDMRVKLDGATPTSGGSTPYFKIYYTAENFDGTSHGESETYSYESSYTCTKSGDGLFYSDWVEYSIDLSSLKGWDSAKSVSKLRIDLLKNGEGTAYIDYIRLLSTPSITKVTYNGGSGLDLQNVPVNTKSFEIYISQPIYSIDETGIRISDDEGSSVDVESVKYNKSDNKITVEVASEFASMTDYTIVFTKEVKVNKLQNLYTELYAPFKTKSNDFEVSVTKARKNEVTVGAINTGSEKRTIIILVTVWDGDVYKGKKAVAVDVEAGDTETKTLGISEITGKNVEVISWEYVQGKPKALGNKVYQYER